MPTKDRSIQSLRGLAAVLLVAGHVVGGDPEHGLRVSDESGWRYVHSALVDLRMPLFTVISGFVYGLRPVRTRDLLPGFLRGKVRRLIVPLLVVGLIYFVAQRVLPVSGERQEWSEVWRVYALHSDPHLWFLQAVFLIFLLVAALDVRGQLEELGRWAVWVGLAMALYVALQVPAEADVFAVNGAMRLLPFFLLGLGLARFSERLVPGRSLPRLPILLGAFALAYGLRLFVLIGDRDVWDPADRLLSVAVATTGVLVLFAVRHVITSRTLAWVGAFSFGVYLLHVLAAAASRKALQTVGVDSLGVLFFFVLAAAVLLPIAFELLFGRFALVSRLILGVRPRPAGPDAR